MCNSKAEGGQRCDGKHHEGHDDAWYAAARARARELYAARHPNTGGHGRKALPADAGPPKRRPSKLNLGAPMLVDMSRGLALGVAPEGHPSKEQLEIHSAAVRARWAKPVEVGDVERRAVVDAEAVEADALEVYRLASGSNPNVDRRPLAERRKAPMPGADAVDGRGWLAAQSKARIRLAVAKRVRAEAEAAYQAAMRPGWDAAEAGAYTAFAAGGEATR